MPLSATRGVHDPQSFDHLSARYDRYAHLVGAELHAWLLFHLPVEGGGQALDAGCGTGTHTGLLADRYTDVLAVDTSAAMLTHATRHRPRANVAYEHRDLHDVGPADGPFDLILSAYTLHHVRSLAVTLAHLRSLLRTGGTVLLVDVVDDRYPVPRSWLRSEAWRTFRADVAGRRRPVAEAVELLRLSLDADWLDHQSTDRLLPPAQWDATARTVFPGADIVDLHRARALHWRAPNTPAYPC